MFKFLLFFLPFFFLGCSDGVPAEKEIFVPTSTSQLHQPMLVIGVEFNDYAFSSTSPSDSWEQKIFGQNSGSVNDYYNEISAGQFQFEPVINENVTTGLTIIKLDQNHPNFYSGTNETTFNNDIQNNLYPILDKALIKVDIQGFDFSYYDNNNDGNITPDELLITYILAGEEDAYSGGIYASGVWAHVDCTTSSSKLDGVNLLGCSSGGNYAVFGERHYDSPDTSHDATIGIIAHELGHAAFALPDLYYKNDSRIGYFGLMASGTWGQANQGGEAGDTPTHMCAWSKIDTGWYSTSPTLDNNTDYQVNATGSTDYNIVKVPLNGSHDEYFLIENRGLGGYDSGLKYIFSKPLQKVIYTNYNGGLAIWHVDEQIIRSKRASNSINSNSVHKGIDLEEASGTSVDEGMGDPELNLYYSGNIDKFTPKTSPNTDSYTGDSSLIYFTNISTRSNTMTINISNKP